MLFAPGPHDPTAIKALVDAARPKPINVLVVRDSGLSVAEASGQLALIGLGQGAERLRGLIEHLQRAGARGAPPARSTELGRAIGPRDAAVRSLMLTWLLVVLIFFSLPTSKLVGYILPALAPLAYFIAESFARRLNGPQARSALKGFAWSLAVSLAICVAAVVVMVVKPQPSTKGLALKLQTRYAASDKVVMLERFRYDLDFYLGVGKSAFVVSDWNDPELARTDNWRRELYDAGKFEPEAGERDYLEGSTIFTFRGRGIGYVSGDGSELFVKTTLAERELVIRSGMMRRRIPLASISRRAIARPRPEPVPSSSEVRWKGSNTRSMSRLGMPIPWSSTVRSTMRPENMIAIAAEPLYICCWTAGWSNVVTCGSM